MGDVYNLEYYVSKAKDLEKMGADSVCIKDMAGMLAPYDAYALVKALKEAVSVPVHLHSHFTSGMASMTHLKAIEAGVDIVGTCMSPYAYRTSHPAIEPLVTTLLGTNRDTGFDIKLLTKIDEILEKDILPKYRHLLNDRRVSITSANVLLHQTPGGMISNLVNQLREMDALDKIDQIYAELPRVRKELGQVPLVTPTSQIIGTQTVNNVLFDDENERYKMITGQVKDLCYGLYGKTPVPINPDLRKKALKGYSRGEEPITCRPAEVLEPELEKAKEDVKDLAVDLDDVLTYVLYPVTGKRFLKWKYSKEEPPAEVKPRTMADVKAEQDLIKKALAGKLVEKPEKEALPKGEGLRRFKVLVDDEYFEVRVEEKGGSAPIAAVAPSPPKPPIPKVPAPVKKSVSASMAQGDGTSLSAPKGETIVILEAMKMENALPSPASGTIKSINFSAGDSVAKGDVLCVIE
jgi:oxaloacetate decarboxylase alpha subunit/pyruvate carboxylase subunit B